MIIRKTLLAAAVALAASAAQAGGLNLLAPAADDLVPKSLSPSLAKAAVRADLDRAPVSFAWAFDTDAAVTTPAGYVAESREYWLTADADALAKGVAIRTTAPGAVLRISPTAEVAKAGGEGRAVLRANGRILGAAEAFASSTSAEQLKAQGVDFPMGSQIYKLRSEIGAGNFEVVVPKARGSYLIHVFEPASVEVLSVNADRTAVAAGGELKVRARLESFEGYRLGSVGGMLTAPNGSASELKFDRAEDGSFVAAVQPDTDLGGADGLWEIHTVAVSEDGKLRRDTKTSFAAVPGTARFSGEVGLPQAKSGTAFSAEFGIEVGRASRFDVSAVLYASNAEGKLVPAGIAHSANFLSAGNHQLRLDFPAELLVKRGLAAPFELRQLTLTDQGSMGVLERRSRALRVD